MPNNMYSGNGQGCAWIPMGGVGNAKCPHKTIGNGAILPSGGIPNNSFSTITGNGFNGPTGVTIPAPGSAKSFTYAMANNNNYNVLGVTFPETDNEGFVSKGKWVTQVSEEVVDKDGNVGYLRPTEDRFVDGATKIEGQEAEREGESRGGESPGSGEGEGRGEDDQRHVNPFEVNDHGKDTPQWQIDANEKYMKKLDAWGKSGEANYPFYSGSGDGEFVPTTKMDRDGTEGKAGTRHHWRANQDEKAQRKAGTFEGK